MNLYQNQYKWIVIDSQRAILQNNSQIPKQFDLINLRMDSDVIIASLLNETTIKIYDMYNLNFNTSKGNQLTEMGYWNYEKELIVTNNLSRYERRKNMAGVLLKSAIVVRGFAFLTKSIKTVTRIIVECSSIR